MAMNKEVSAVTSSHLVKRTDLLRRSVLLGRAPRFGLSLTGAFLLALLVSTENVRADRYDILRADRTIESGLLMVAIGDAVRDNCSEFEPRRVLGLAFLNGLINRAKLLGYSMDEIRAYVDNDDEKSRVKARARQWLLQQGADFKRPETLCRIARNEIAKNSRMGRLIREK